MLESLPPNPRKVPRKPVKHPAAETNADAGKAAETTRAKSAKTKPARSAPARIEPAGERPQRQRRSSRRQLALETSPKEDAEPPGDLGAQLRPLARQHSQVAIAALVAVMEDATTAPTARIAAATALLNWAYGKPGGAPDELSSRRNNEQIIRLSWDEPEKS